MISEEPVSLSIYLAFITLPVMSTFLLRLMSSSAQCLIFLPACFYHLSPGPDGHQWIHPLPESIRMSLLASGLPLPWFEITRTSELFFLHLS